MSCDQAIASLQFSVVCLSSAGLVETVGGYASSLTETVKSKVAETVSCGVGVASGSC